MLLALLTIIDYLTQILFVAILVQFALSLLVMFGVISAANQFVAAILTAINAILDPVLRPIRRMLPDTGMIDFSPLVLIIGLQILRILLAGLATDLAY